MTDYTYLLIAHRGASGYEPENTLRAFKRALAMNAHAIELDVFVCKTGEPVIIHDANIKRTTNGKGLVSSMSLRQLKRYNAGNGEQIPTLIEALELIDAEYLPQRTNGLILNLDLKGNNTAKPVADILHRYLTANGWSPDNFMISSFNHHVIRELKQYVPAIKTGAIFYKNTMPFIKATQAAHAEHIIAHYPSVTAELIKKAHVRGLSIWAYTVNDKTIAQKLIDWCIDGIITNYPDLLDETRSSLKTDTLKSR